MKSNLLKFAVLAISALPLISCSEDDDNSGESIITAQELPEKAQSFISTHFPSDDFTRVEKKATPDRDGSVYEINLSSNFEIDFTAEGQWVDIEGNEQQLPEGIVPVNISAYIADNYPDQFITGIDTEADAYEIDLSNDVDVQFDKDGNFVREEK